MQRLIWMTLLALICLVSSASADAWKRDDRMRFIVTMGGVAVHDRETGLVWQREPPSPLFVGFNAAQLICLNLRVGERMGWRPPLAHELMSLHDPTTADGLPAGHPFRNITGDPFMTGTFLVQNGLMLTKSLTGFGLNQEDPNTVNARIWCVRGAGQSTDG